MHAKVGDLVRTASGREGRVKAVQERPGGGWVADVEVRCAAGGGASILPYDAVDLTVLRFVSGGEQAMLLEDKSVR